MFVPTLLLPLPFKTIPEDAVIPMAPHSNEKNQDRNEARKLTVERGTTLLRKQKRGFANAESVAARLVPPQSQSATKNLEPRNTN